MDNNDEVCSNGIFTAKLVTTEINDELDHNINQQVIQSSDLTNNNKVLPQKKDSVLPNGENINVKELLLNGTTQPKEKIDSEVVPDIIEDTHEVLKPALKSTGSSAPLNEDKKEKHVSFESDHIEKHYEKQPWFLGAIGRILGLKFAPINIPLERRFQTFAVLFWMSSFLFMGFGALFMFIYMFFYTKYWWISLCYLTWFIGDRSVCNRGGRRLQWMRRWQLWKHKANFYPTHLIKTVDIDPNKHYIFGYHPHGILCSGAFSHFATEGTNFTELFPNLTPYLLTLEGHFLLPIYREFFMCTGAVSATRESMNYLLSREKKGNALCLVVGGAPEALDCHPGLAVLNLQKRKGFCKMALRHGASLVPMYSFGENEVYDQVANPPGSWMRWMQDSLQKYIGLAPAIFMGRGVFQYSFGIVPFRKPIYTVVGAPIHVDQIPNPTKEQIESLHARYVASLKELYDKYKHNYSQYPDVDLVIR